jgi:hypothetical protein
MPLERRLTWQATQPSLQATPPRGLASGRNWVMWGGLFKRGPTGKLTGVPELVR